MNTKKLLLGYDLGSSFVKASLLDVESGDRLASVSYPEKEMKIYSPENGWAEQNPDEWWKNVVKATRLLINEITDFGYVIEAIGISYQMHGLVIVDKNRKVLHPSIIWCDSRAVNIGDNAFKNLGTDFCLKSYLNSPGNFTASKLSWIKENQPEIFSKIFKIMLPGEYIAMKMTDEILTTVSGLSEGIFWNFEKGKVASELLNFYGFERNIIPDVVDTFSFQGKLTQKAADELGIKKGIKVGYRAGDQPNNAFSLNVMYPGEFAATAGTSGVIYGITEKNLSDIESRVNSFAHLNYSEKTPYKGVLLCINGTGILYSWLRYELFTGKFSYEEMNNAAFGSPIGSNGIKIYPFGNGAERSLGNKDLGCRINSINLTKSTKPDIIRASQEGIAFAFKYGIEIMNGMGMKANVLRAGYSNMFLSEVFQDAVANVCNVNIELFNTDGAQGAARGAGVGIGIYSSYDEAFKKLKKIKAIQPDKNKTEKYNSVYQEWKTDLTNILKHKRDISSES